MKRLFISLIVVIVMSVFVGCGEENQNPTEENAKYVSLTIDQITANPIDQYSNYSVVDYRVVIEFTVENFSSESLGLGDNVYLEDSDDDAIYYQWNIHSNEPFFLDAPAVVLPKGKARCKINCKMSDVLYQWKKAKGPYKLVLSYGYEENQRVVKDLPSWEEIKGLANTASSNENPPTQPEPKELEVNQPHPTVDLREYIPLAVGNSWTYNRSGNIYKLFIDQTVEIEGKKYFQMKYESGGKVEDMWQCLAISPDGKELWQNGPYAYIDQGMIIGQEIVTVPAGTFDCIKVERKVDVIGGTGSMYEWYGKGVGLVKTDHNIDNPASLKDYLIDYRIN